MKWSSCVVLLALILPGCGGATAQPDDPAKPAEAMKSAQPAEPMTPAAPQQPAEPARPARPSQPSQPMTPATPTPAQAVALAVPAEDLVRQADKYVAAIVENVATEDAYNDSKEDLARQANTLVVIVWALGQYDRNGKYQDLEPILAAAGDLAAAKDYHSASGAAGRLKTAIGRMPEAPVTPPATPPASLAQLMKEVPIINTKLKRDIRDERLKARAKETAGYSAVLAAIGQGSDGSKEAAKTPEQVAQWHKFCLELRDAAVAANRGIHAGDPQATATAMAKLAASCDDCHAVFHKEEKK
ncbi:MAG: hypothetical protein ACLQLG_00925 [Thermoguttaceae bacterium]